MGFCQSRVWRGICGVLITGVGLALVVGSGGGGGDVAPSTPPTSTTVSGVAALSGPLAGASVTVIDSSASTTDPAAVTTAADGSYSVDVSGLEGQLAIRVTGLVEGSPRTLVSVLPSITVNATNIANVTPLSNAVAALIAPNGDPAGLFVPSALASAATATNVGNSVAVLVNTLATDPAIATLLGANFNPMTTLFAANGTGIASVLDRLSIAVSSRGVQIINLAAPVAEQGAPLAVLLTPANLANPISVPTLPPSAAADDVPSAADIEAIRVKLQACMALPRAQRVTYDSSGTNPTALAPACDFADPNFRSNGRTWVEEMGRVLPSIAPVFSKGQFDSAVFGLGAISLALAPQNLTGAKEFKHPQCNLGPCAVVRYPVSTASGYTDAWDFRFGKVAGQWQIVGNQLPYDVSIATVLNRFVAVNPTPPNNAFGFNSRIESTLLLTFNPSGRNGNLVRAVRLKGPGVPTAGLTYHRSLRCGTDTRFPLTNQTGSLRDAGNAVITFNNGSTRDFVQDAANLDGSTLALPTGFFNYSPTQIVNLPSVAPAWTRYAVEIFLFSNTATPDVPDEILFIRTDAPAASAADGATRAWPTLSQAFVDAYLKPTGAGAGTVTGPLSMDWSAPTGAKVHTSYLFRQDAQTLANVNGIVSTFTKRTRLDFEPAAYGNTTAPSFGLASVLSGASLAPETANAAPNPNPRCTNPALVPVTNDPVSYYEVGLGTRLPDRQRQNAVWFWDN